MRRSNRVSRRCHDAPTARMTPVMCFVLLIFLALPPLMFGDREQIGSTRIDPTTFDMIDTYIVGRMGRYGIPGMAIGIIGEEGVLHLRGFGKADPSGRDVTPQTPFVLGSVSKPFTALAIMQLYEAGKLGLDEPVVTYLPKFILADGEGSGITIRHLLNHTSGIGTEGEWQVAATDGEDSLDDLVAKMAAMRVDGPPGSDFRYSNANYIILGGVVETVSGMTFGEYVTRFIFEPLGMSHSYVSYEEAKADGLAHGYVSVFGFPHPSSVPYRNDFVSAYYLISCAEDMTHFMSMFMEEGRYVAKELLSPRGISQMLAASEDSNYGFGWFVGSENVYHGGSTIDYQAKVNILFGRGMASVILCNTSDSTASLFGAGYRDIIETDIFSILFGYDEDVGRFGNPRGYLFLAVVQITIVAGIAALLLYSLFRLISFRKRLEAPGLDNYLVRTIVLNVVLPGVLFAGPLLIGRTSWPVLLYHYRDFAGVTLIAAAVLVVEGAAKGIIAVSTLRQP